MKDAIFFYKMIENKILHFVVSILNSASGMLYTYIFAYSTQLLMKAIFQQEDIKGSITKLVIIPLTAIFFGLVSTYMNTTRLNTESENLKKSLIKKALYSNQSSFSKYGKNEIMSVLNGDLKTISDIIVNNFSRKIIGPTIEFLGCTIFLSFINFKLTILAYIFSFTYFFVQNISLKSETRYNKSLREASDKENLILTDIIQNKNILEQNFLHPYFQEHSEKLLNLNEFIKKRISHIQNFKIGINDIFKNMAEILFILLYLSIIKSDSVPIIFFFAANRYFSSIIFIGNNIIKDIGDIKASKAVFQRARKMFDTLEIQKELPKEIENKESSITIKNLEVVIDKRKIFSGIDISIQKGEKVLIIGKNGVGKSTLAKCMANLENRMTSETFFINGKIAYIPANHFIFNTTAKENISLFNKNINDMEIITATKELGIKKGNFNKNTLYKKVEFSEGEKARFSLERINKSEFDIFIFDEPTANVDDLNKKIVLDYIFKKFSEKTVIIIAHDIYDYSIFHQIITL